MIKNCVFQLPANSKENMINTFHLQHIVSNNRTSIFENNEMRFSIDAKVVRVVLFDGKNTSLLEKLKKYFYGEEYE